MYALVDCNNFYVSCERVYNPGLNKQPVIVLSNNDGCAISRSDEAKALGIEMGAVPHLFSEHIKKQQVKMFSSNYTLYGDISDRVMKTLASFVPRMEIYSIDEAFLDMSNMPFINLSALGLEIRTAVLKNTGIPTCVGIAPTKALAKMANRFAKKNHKKTGVYAAFNQLLIDEMLNATAVGDVWGIGRQYALMLNKNNITTAMQFVTASEDFIRASMSVVGLRLQKELKGIACFPWEFETPAKKNICTGRSFGSLITDKKLINEALSNFAGTCALKLRQQNSVAKKLKVFINTNPHRLQDKQYFHSIVITFDVATADTAAIIKYALKGMDLIYKEGYNYMKCGVELLDLIPDGHVQGSLFSTTQKTNNKLALAALDKVNKSMGKELVRFGIQGFKKNYKARAEFLSPCYTTRISDIIKIDT